MQISPESPVHNILSPVPNEEKSVSVVSAHSLCENTQRYQTSDSMSSVKSPEKGCTTRLVTWCL